MTRMLSPHEEYKDILENLLSMTHERNKKIKSLVEALETGNREQINHLEDDLVIFEKQFEFTQMLADEVAQKFGSSLLENSFDKSSVLLN